MRKLVAVLITAGVLVSGASAVQLFGDASDPRAVYAVIDGEQGIITFYNTNAVTEYWGVICCGLYRAG
jgi:hypothetical protein